MMLRQLGSSLGKKEIKLDLCLSHHTPKYISDGSNISILKKETINIKNHSNFFFYFYMGKKLPKPRQNKSPIYIKF